MTNVAFDAWLAKYVEKHGHPYADPREAFEAGGATLLTLTHNVIAVKPDCFNPTQTKVESFGPFTREQADAYALALSEEIKAEWLFFSQQAQGNDIDPEHAARFLLAL